jgi:P-type Cu2+ transporter
MSCCAGTIVASYAGNVMASQCVEEIRSNGRQLSDGAVLYAMSVPGVHCGACISLIERELMKIEGVRSARLNLTLRTLMLALSSAAVDLAPVVRHLEQLGYPPMSVESGAEQDVEQTALVRALAVAGFAATNIMLLSVSVWTGADGATRDLFHFISALIAVPAVAYAGQPFFRSAAGALRRRRMNMDVPISLGVLLATLMSLIESLRGGEHAYFDAAVSLVFFLLIGRTLDHMMRAKARHLVSQLARLSAKGGMVIGSSGALSYAPLESIHPGMVLRVAAGERVPVDGEIVSGESEIDRSFVTGESDPVPVGPQIVLEAGTMNLTGALDIRAVRAAKDSFLSDVMQMMAAAEQGRGRYVRMADRMARIYAPFVHILALASFVGWMLVTRGDWHQSLTIAISVLIITCPCALGLAVPVAHVISASRLFRVGILMKDGSALERMAEVDHVACDKTGTLTTGEPRISCCAIPNGAAVSVARSLAAQSRHPASHALALHLANAPSVNLDRIREVPGYGVAASWNGREVRLGRSDWVADIASSHRQDEDGPSFAIEAEPAYSIEIAEQLRPGAPQMMAHLASQGLRAEMLSGDSAAAVSRIASALGMIEVRSDLRPADKLARLAELSGQGCKVLMVGDGLNDAPSLAAAHVSMAPSSASDIGRNAADFVFTRGDLRAVAVAHEIAIHARRIVQQNFGLAIAYNAFAVPLAIAGLLNPLIAAVAMSTSSIIVIGNSMRLLRVEYRDKAKAGSEAMQSYAMTEMHAL